jgi:hypothetical protein
VSNQLQLVTQPTHDAGNMLDLLVVADCHSNNQMVSDVTVSLLCFTDHSFVRCGHGVRCPRPVSVTYHYHQLNGINLCDFRDRILQSKLYNTSTADVKYTVDTYTELLHSKLRMILNACAPVPAVTRRSGTHDNHQLPSKARATKRACRRSARCFRRSGIAEDCMTFNRARKYACAQINKPRVDHMRDEPDAASGDSRKLWRTTHRLLHPSPQCCLNDAESTSMAVKFCQFSLMKSVTF